MMIGRDEDRPKKYVDPAAPILTIDYALYDRYLEGVDLSDDKKREFLDAMWSVIVEFVMLGFEVHPAQQAIEACGKLSKGLKTSPNLQHSVVKLDRTTRNDFEGAASEQSPQAAERIQE